MTFATNGSPLQTVAWTYFAWFGDLYPFNCYWPDGTEFWHGAIDGRMCWWVVL